MDEKRRFPRLDIAVDVAWKKISARDNVAGSVDPSKTKNISECGICLIVYEDVSVGDWLRLDIPLPTLKVVHAVGRVVWCSHFELASEKNRKSCDIGIEFMEITPQDREEIKQFVVGWIK